MYTATCTLPGFDDVTYTDCTEGTTIDHTTSCNMACSSNLRPSLPSISCSDFETRDLELTCIGKSVLRFLDISKYLIYVHLWRAPHDPFFKKWLNQQKKKHFLKTNNNKILFFVHILFTKRCSFSPSQLSCSSFSSQLGAEKEHLLQKLNSSI